MLTRAAVDALSPPMGPVSVEIPIDIQRTPIARPALLDNFSLPLPPPLPPAPAELDELAARVEQAQAADAVDRCRCAPRGSRGRAGCSISASAWSAAWAGRGTVPEDHPMNLAGLHGNGMPAIQAFYRDVDLMLVVGSRLRGQETGEFAVKLPDESDPDRHRSAGQWPHLRQPVFRLRRQQAGAAGTARAARGSDWRVDARLRRGVPRRCASRRRAEFASTLGRLRTFSDQLRAVMPRDAIWVRDITQSNTTWGNRLFPLYDPRNNVYPVGAGIGQGLQLGIGAAAGGRRAQDRRDDRRWRVLPEHRRAVDRRAGQARSSSSS